jgi:hypothetical protein
VEADSWHLLGGVEWSDGNVLCRLYDMVVPTARKTTV